MNGSRFWLCALSALITTLLARGPIALARDAASATRQPADFGRMCAACHGDDAEGTDRAPALAGNALLQGMSTGGIAAIIVHGRGSVMPAFSSLPPARVQALAGYIRSLNTNASEVKAAGSVAAGRRIFFGSGRCVACHTAEGRGGIAGPDLSNIADVMTLAQLRAALRHPHPWTTPGWNVVTVTLRNGKSLRGFARNQGQHSLDLQTFDGRLLPLLDTQYRQIVPDKNSSMPPFPGSAAQMRDLLAFLSRLRGVSVDPDLEAHDRLSASALDAVIHPRAGDWATYSGNVDGNRYSPLAHIDAQNVSSLALAWVRPLPYDRLETTPLVLGGIMYVTGPNQVYALDARTGGVIWSYVRPRSRANTVAVDAAIGANRGAAVLGDRLYFLTDNAHLLCLQRITGALLWEVSLPPPGAQGRFGGTVAPLIAGGVVIAGVSGGDQAIRGFLDAYDPITGRRVWRFWTVPEPGDPTYRTWGGDPSPRGGPTWSIGSYEPDTGILYIGIGNPYPDTDGDGRQGDDLYTASDLALDARTGKLRWYFQFTPHDVHDWDANQPVVLADAPFHGRTRRLLLHANRNGFFYVLDRTNGKLLQATPFVKRLNWATGIAPDGRPILSTAARTTVGGTTTCPAVRGATNWYSTAYDPLTGLYYVMAVEDCTIYRKSDKGGDYTAMEDPQNPAIKVLRAIRVDGGEIAWQVPLLGNPEENYSGVLATAGGLVFFGETTGAFAAVDARTGKPLWHFDGNQVWKGSPMTYMVGGRQYIAIASGRNILAFALPDGEPH